MQILTGTEFPFILINIEEVKQFTEVFFFFFFLSFFLLKVDNLRAVFFFFSVRKTGPELTSVANLPLFYMWVTTTAWLD